MAPEDARPEVLALLSVVAQGSPEAVEQRDDAVWRDVEAIATLIADARAKVDQRVDTLHVLRAVAEGGSDAVEGLDALVGPLALQRDQLTSERARDVLREWTTYFKPDLADVDKFRDEIRLGQITDLRTMYDVAEIADDLLSAAQFVVRDLESAS